MMDRSARLTLARSETGGITCSEGGLARPEPNGYLGRR